MTYIAYFICYFYFLNSPFLFVYGDDRVIRYTRVDVDTGDAKDAQATEWGLAWELELGDFHIYFVMFSFMNKNFGTCNTFVIYVISFGACFHILNFLAFGN